MPQEDHRNPAESHQVTNGSHKGIKGAPMEVTRPPEGHHQETTGTPIEATRSLITSLRGHLGTPRAPKGIPKRAQQQKLQFCKRVAKVPRTITAAQRRLRDATKVYQKCRDFKDFGHFRPNRRRVAKRPRTIPAAGRQKWGGPITDG